MNEQPFDPERWEVVDGFSFEDITYHRARGQGTVRVAFDRPDCRNAFRPQTVDELLAAGVRIFEYGEGLLHAKTLTLDGEVTLIGSANMDRRSFDLNYENNILVYDPVLSRAVRQRQESYIASSKPVTLAEVEAWTLPQRLLNNTLAMLGPVL